MFATIAKAGGGAWSGRLAPARRFFSSRYVLPAVFFDGGCPLCVREIGHYQRLAAPKDHESQPLATFVDISTKAGEQALSEQNITMEQAMARLHVLDRRNEVISGAVAFVELWNVLPYWKWLGRACENIPGLLPTAEIVYTAFAKRRLLLTGRSAVGTSCRADKQ